VNGISTAQRIRLLQGVILLVLVMLAVRVLTLQVIDPAIPPGLTDGLAPRVVSVEPPRGRILDRFDTNGDGMLDEAERQAMREQEAARRAEQEARMLERWDRDGDGVLSRQERRAMEQDQRRRLEDQMRRMTAEFDQDGDGQLNADEQARAWQVTRERREIDAFVRRYDSNGDGRINTTDLNAFLQLYQAGDRRADVNNDGVVDALDVTAFRDMMNRSANRP
jgi:Ca2+-binding EF-hand superfamily protein